MKKTNHQQEWDDTSCPELQNELRPPNTHAASWGGRASLWSLRTICGRLRKWKHQQEFWNASSACAFGGLAEICMPCRNQHTWNYRPYHEFANVYALKTCYRIANGNHQTCNWPWVWASLFCVVIGADISRIYESWILRDGFMTPYEAIQMDSQ